MGLFIMMKVVIISSILFLIKYYNDVNHDNADDCNIKHDNLDKR